MKRISILLMVMLAVCACDHQTGNEIRKTENGERKTENIQFPVFNADSAFAFVKKQTDFGPRVPNTEAHQQCADWLVHKLSEYADTVMVQEFRTRLFNGQGIDGQNIIATFNPKAPKRIVLCAHWDSRPFADHDPDEANWNHPIDGANDGASGVGVLIETARCFRSQPLPEKLGVDIVLFDLEDFGPRSDQAEQYYDEQHNHWALGSQHWAAQPHTPGYHANYGILLDMVGASEPNFMKEYFSQGYAGWWCNKVWRNAQDLGYRQYFVNELGNPITDDHIAMNEIAGIPTIDIIDLRPDSSNESFPETWHTLDDNIDNIDKNTLEMVGKVLIFTVYSE